MRPMDQRGVRVGAVVVGGLATLGLGGLLGQAFPALSHAQVAHSLAKIDVDEARRAIPIDFAFMAAYFVLGWAGFSFIRDPHDRARRYPAATAGVVLVAGGVLADAVEDVFLKLALDGRAVERNLGVMRTAGVAKWGLLGAALLVFVVLVLRGIGRDRATPHLPSTRPAEADWDPPSDHGTPRVGVCLAGGGIRAAAFSLGALQCLREHDIIDRADYLAAVSGGGYLAAGWALSDATVPTGTAPKPWTQGSPEERWFRNHSSYIVPNTALGFVGLMRLLAGVAVNLLLIGAVLFVVARPVGWVISALQPLPDNAKPVVLIRDGHVKFEVADISGPEVIDNGDSPPIERYDVMIQPVAGDQACFDWANFHPDDRDVCVDLKGREPGVVDVVGGKAQVVRQPKVGVVHGDCSADQLAAADKADKVRCRVDVPDNPDLTIDHDVQTGGALDPGDVAVKSDAVVDVKTGPGGMPYPTYETWMWELPVGLVLLALLVGLGIMASRPRGRRADVLRALANALAGASLVAFVVVVALPWLVVWLPRTQASLFTGATHSASASGLGDYLLPGGGLLAVAAMAVRQVLTGPQQASAGTVSATPWYRKVWGGLTKAKTQLGWYDWTPAKIVAGVVFSVGAVVVFINLLQFAVVNGFSGTLMGFAFIRDRLPGWLFVPEWGKFALAAAALGLFALVGDAHSWSLYPFYKRRLSSAYLLDRVNADAVKPRDYGQFETFSQLRASTGPQLIACCAVNLSEYGVVPPGRRAASFTFSSSEIGGPLVGYATPDQYEALPARRKRDVTVPSAMAISGAAFSPAMGKFNLGPIGGVLAIANLRLGVWLPHPDRVARGSDEYQARRRRPNWMWYFRELTNKYAFDRRYLYVSDGGHWDNLGLVELLRRGCTEIYCISGAGDGPDSFGTIGEAMALAREELGVEFDLDPSPLRAPVKAAGDPPVRDLRRSGADAPYAAKPAVMGTFRYTRCHPVRTGTIYYAEADLTVDIPFDVHVYAEGEAVFPDDSTGDQVFDHRQFEAYRALGHFQGEAVVKLATSPSPAPAPALPPEPDEPEGSLTISWRRGKKP